MPVQMAVDGQQRRAATSSPSELPRSQLKPYSAASTSATTAIAPAARPRQARGDAKGEEQAQQPAGARDDEPQPHGAVVAEQR